MTITKCMNFCMNKSVIIGPPSFIQTRYIVGNIEFNIHFIYFVTTGDF